MKNSRFDLGVLVLICVVVYLYTFPKTETKVEEKIKLIKGDTSEVIRLRNCVDSLEYVFHSYKDSIQQIRPRAIFAPGEAKIDTLLDTVFLPFNFAHFNLGDSILGTSGRVEFFHNDSSFKFDSIKYRYPEIIKSVTDTLKITKEIELETVWYENTWFYSTVVLLYLFIQSII